jgi:integrase
MKTCTIGAVRLANTHPLSGILPSSEELKKMGRPRYQHPNVKKTSPKLGRARWHVRVMVDVLVDRNRTERKERVIYLGFCDEMGKREAEKERDRQLQNVNNTPLVIQSQVLFKDLVEAYKKTYLPGLKPSSRHQFSHRIDKHILAAFRSAQLYEIDSIKVQQWIYQLEDAGLGLNSRRGALTVLRSIFEAAEEWGYFTGRNPCKRIKVGDGLELHELKALEPHQLLRLVQVCEEPLRLMVELAAYTGLRASEILGLTWRAIDCDRRMAIVRQSVSQQGEVSTPKTKAGRREVDLGSLVTRFVRPAKAKDDELIWNESYRAYQGRLRHRAETLGVYFKGLGFHTLRRTYATLRDGLGARKPDAVMVAAMGHANASMTEHYIRRADAGMTDRIMEVVNFSGISREFGKPN